MTLNDYVLLYVFTMCGIVQVPRVVTVAFRDHPTDCVLAASIYLTAKSAKDICKTIVSMKYSVKSARYIYKSYITSPSYVFYILYKSHYYFVIVTRYLVCVLQNCEKRRTKYRRTALSNVVSETSLPVTQFDTSFETLINTRQHAIEDIARDAIQQHGYNNAFVLLQSVFLQPLIVKNSSHFQFSLILTTLYILQICSHSAER